MNQTPLKVQLLSITANAEALVFAACRQCYKNGFVGDDWERILSGAISREQQLTLIRKVIDSGHTSTIEHVSASFAIEGISRTCSHQLVRHRLASYAQQSQRYVTGNDTVTAVVPETIRKRPELRRKFEAFVDQCGQLYAELIAAGIPAEDARFVLPNAAETKLVLTMNARELYHFLRHRQCVRAQWEIRAMATQMQRLLADAVPVLFEHVGAACEMDGVCPENATMTCGRKPRLEELLKLAGAC